MFLLSPPLPSPPLPSRRPGMKAIESTYTPQLLPDGLQISTLQAQIVEEVQQVELLMAARENRIEEVLHRDEILALPRAPSEKSELE